MKIMIVERTSHVPYGGINEGYLVPNNWNDYSFETLFRLFVFDELGVRHELGDVKIGFTGQTEKEKTKDYLPKSFNDLYDRFFSLGDGAGYYKELKDNLNSELRNSLLTTLRDVAHNESILKNILEEKVFIFSLLRNVDVPSITGQFKRILDGRGVLTSFDFVFKRQADHKLGGIMIPFKVKENSRPSTNIHALIGRNGVGKTTLLNSMVSSLTDNNFPPMLFTKNFIEENPINENFFSNLISISFSAFDPFTPPKDQPDPSKGLCYYYIGLKNTKKNNELLNIGDLHTDFDDALETCISNEEKKELLLDAATTLSSDPNFESQLFISMIEHYDQHNISNTVFDFAAKLSSGHFIVTYLIVKLISRVSEKTLVLIDEPESHLHPPLLSSFIRVLNDILHSRNGVAIIATHSPVVLQEIPKSCVNKIYRSGNQCDVSKPEIQTLGENIGTITRDVFGLEVNKSGFHKLLESSVEAGGSFEKIMADYNHELGHEAQGILRTLIMFREMEEGK